MTFHAVLPEELQLLIVSWLDAVSIGRLAITCCEWRRVLRDGEVWRLVFLHEFQTNVLDYCLNVTTAIHTYKEQYTRRLHMQRRWVNGRPVVKTMQSPGEITCLQFHESRLLSGGVDGSLVLWDLEGRRAAGCDGTPQFSFFQQHHIATKQTQRLHSFRGHSGPIWALDARDDTLVSGSYDKTIKIWSIKSGCVRSTLRGHTHWLSGVKLSSLAADRVISTSWDGSVRCWDTEALRCISVFQMEQQNVPHCFHECSRRFAVIVGTGNQAVHIDLDTQQAVARFHCAKPVYCIQADEAKLITGHTDGSFRVFDPHTNQCVVTVPHAHNKSIMTLAYDDCKLITGSGDAAVKIWDMRRVDHCLQTLYGHSKAVFSLQFDKSRLVTGSADHTVRVWEF